MTGAEDVIRQLVARLGDAADFHFAPKYVDCIVEEYVDKIAGLDDGTCKAIPTGCATAICSECGAEYLGSIVTNEPPDYVKALVRCPNCGRKVVDE